MVLPAGGGAAVPAPHLFRGVLWVLPEGGGAAELALHWFQGVSWVLPERRPRGLPLRSDLHIAATVFADGQSLIGSAGLQEWASPWTGAALGAVPMLAPT